MLYSEPCSITGEPAVASVLMRPASQRKLDMTFEEMERTLHFILERQAQISGNVQRHDENLLVIETKLGQLGDVMLKLADSHVLLVNSHKQLADAHARSEQAHRQLEERVDAFIVFVEKYISSRNGGEKAAQ